jgi:hypothetical protein
VWERAGRLQDACDGSYFNGTITIIIIIIIITSSFLINCHDIGLDYFWAAPGPRQHQAAALLITLHPSPPITNL